MIQSKNKFLPTLYIRKCKITYLECFAITQTDGRNEQLFSSKAWHYSSTSHMLGHVDEYMARWVDGWTKERWRSSRSPVRCSQTQNQTTWMWMCRLEYRLANKFTWNTGRRSEKWVYACECTCICEWSVISALDTNTHTKPHWTEQLPTAPAARGNTITRVLVSIFWSGKLCWKV